ncbi:MAG: ATP-binding protein [Rhodothermales bacterium]
MALGSALLVLGFLVVLGAWAFMNYSSRAYLASEVNNFTAHVVRGDRLDLDAYPWSEPHHRFTERHIDPHFIQVFDAEGRPLRSSANVARLGESFPARRLPVTGADPGVGRLRTFEAEGTSFYYLATPLATQQGTPLGYLQIARYEPGIGAMIGRIGFGLAVGYVVALAGLLALLWAVGGRVVRPLEAMTTAARNLSPDRLDQRVPVPPDADRETAELGRALNDALTRLEGAFDEVHRFTADAAHELQTPLTVLLGHVEVALRRERSTEAYRETLRVLQAEAEGLVRTVRGLLALARSEGPSAPHEFVDLGLLAHEEADAVRPQAEAKGLALTVSAEAGVRVMGHPTLLREAAQNLLDNAVKYTNAGEVRVGVQRRDGHVAFAVEDTGVGIAPELLPHVTARFWRADGVQHLPGSGLGLPLVEQVATYHGGRFRIDSEPGVGTRAEMLLPVG